MSMLRRALVMCVLALPCAASANVPEGVDAFGKSRFADARKVLAAPAEAGEAQAMAYMGEMLMRGLGGSRDELKARDYITRAHAAGNPRAGFLLGNMYLTGNLVERDGPKGADIMRIAAEKGEPAAQNAIGAWLANGTNGFAKDDDIALGWFKLAADQKHPAALGWLGAFAESGRAGVPQDNLVALDWYKKGGDLGDAASMVAAGRMYALGRGVSPNGTEALAWLHRAAALANSSAFAWIANVYEFGRGGIWKNPTLAYVWYSAVPANGTPAAVKAAAEGKERLSKTMSAAEIADAEKRWKTVVLNTIMSTINPQIATGTAPAGAGRTGVYGSGVVVSEAGEVLTNEHVINSCARVRIQPSGAMMKVVARDARNDLALLRGEGLALPPVRLRAGRNVRLGDEVVALGYPLRGMLSSGTVVTTGIVNALTGLNDDTSMFQISATVQPGSSGGPILDRGGSLVGIVRARLLPTGPASPQNVNFGINLATVSSFLDTHSVGYLMAQPGAKPPADTADLVERARRSTVQVECY
ncbi:MAG: trypsin-like peptidase domain-containing protein [Rhodocyclaceae bacterium]|nr:trypsin-like peptidase domain-containing protein [Rhodocyclaceae bacterium]MCA3110411.1 trypsin-like peptidase domain-containing protein [Rhodocyclaceae bacterium]